MPATFDWDESLYDRLALVASPIPLEVRGNNFTKNASAYYCEFESVGIVDAFVGTNGTFFCNMSTIVFDPDKPQ